MDETGHTALPDQVSESRYRALFESSPISLWEEDFSGVLLACRQLQDGGVKNLGAYLLSNPTETLRLVSLVRVVDVNQRTVELFEASSKADLLGPIGDVATDDALPALAREFAALVGGASAFEAELPGQTLSGKPLALLVKLTVSPGYESDLGRVLVSSIDITGRKGIEAELARYRDSLEELVERRTAQLQSVHNELIEALGARDRLMANVSHEMRTPLNSIIGFTGIVLQGLTGDIGAETRTQLEMVDRSGRQLLAMVDDLLEFANVSVKGVHVEERETDLAALLHTTCEMVRELAKEKGLVIRCGHMQPPAVHTDAVRVQQVVLNLLGNAIKFTESGWIGMECAMRDDTVRISVSDTGPGIPVESRERIFEAFHQLTPARGAKHSGTGLGLAIAREVTSALGGRLSVAARTGGGSIFTLALPIDPQSRECADGEPDSATASPEDDSPAR